MATIFARTMRSTLSALVELYIYIFVISSDWPNKLCTWWQRTRLHITVAVLLGAPNRKYMRDTAIAPVTMRHKVENCHVPVLSKAPLYLKNRNAVVLKLLLKSRNRNGSGTTLDKLFHKKVDIYFLFKWFFCQCFRLFHS